MAISAALPLGKRALAEVPKVFPRAKVRRVGRIEGRYIGAEPSRIGTRGGRDDVARGARRPYRGTSHDRLHIRRLRLEPGGKRQLPLGSLSWYHHVMSQSTRDTTKRKRADQAGTPVMVRLQPDQLQRLDDWIEEDGGRFSRPEAIRVLLNHAWGLTAASRGVKFAPDRIAPAPNRIPQVD